MWRSGGAEHQFLTLDLMIMINFGGLLRNYDNSTGRGGGYDVGAIRLGGDCVEVGETTSKSSFLSFFHNFTEIGMSEDGCVVVGGGREGGKHPS